jgi:hypothetical protein
MEMEKTTKECPTKGEISIRLYARSADQEFTRAKQAWHNDIWWGDTNWNDKDGDWADKVYDNVKYTDMSIHQPKTIARDSEKNAEKREDLSVRKTAEQKLADLIKIRKDTEDYGFVKNVETREIFLVNNTVIWLLREMIEEPSETLSENQQAVLEQLNIKA